MIRMTETLIGKNVFEENFEFDPSDITEDGFRTYIAAHHKGAITLF